MSKVKSLLVNVPLSSNSTTTFYVMPPALLSLAAYLRANGESVTIFDINVAQRKNISLLDQLEVSPPDLVGISVMVAGQMKMAHELAKTAKEFSSDTVVVVGGAHASQFPEEILQVCPEIDFVVIGEGETQLLECVRFADTKDLSSIVSGGVAYRSEAGVVVRRKTSNIKDINSLPVPAYDMINFEDYRHDTATWHNPYQEDFGVRVPIITSRGCPNLCNFCSVAKSMGLAYRPLRSSSVVDMMQSLHEMNNIYYFAIYDANFAQDVNRVVEICNEISRRNLKFRLDLPTGLPINSAAKEMIEALASVGLIRTCISVESGDPEIRNKFMKKNVEQDEIFRIVEAIRQHPQIFLVTDFVLGMPEDTQKSVEASYRLMVDLDIDELTLCLATPYPGTALYSQCEKDNLFIHKHQDLLMADWYCHNIAKEFFIRPYNLSVECLVEYRNKILALRDIKLETYRRRMKKSFGIESGYRKGYYERL
jgi:anaerobic magnesium-protoporphyrin IX monomethyl ester cyclase